MTNLPPPKCPICQYGAEKHLTQNVSSHVACDSCGSYDITLKLSSFWEEARKNNGGRLTADDETLLPYLSAYIKQSRSRVALTTENWVQFAVTERSTPISTKLRRLLEHVGSLSRAPGTWITLNMTRAAPLVSARDKDEVDFLIRYAANKGYVQTRDMALPGAAGVAHGMTTLLTFDGWEFLQPSTGGAPGTCFVAMSLNAALDDAFDKGIQPAVEVDCRFSVVRVDRVLHNDDITDRIIAGIRSAEFIVADFTGQRPSVYFEAGYAVALGRDVIWCCREDEIQDLHFDTRQISHIAWKTPEDLRKQLAHRIQATITSARRAD